MKNLAYALVESARSKKALAEVLEDLKTVSQAFHLDPHLRADLDEPAVPLAKRQEALKDALAKTIHPYVTNTLLLLQESGSLAELDAFITNVADAARELADHYDAKVTSAVPLKKGEREDLEELLARTLNGTVTLDEKVDPSILGGLIVDAGDWHVDASVKGRLDRLTQQLYV
jgi:F-type H+-transporting ATPase subunit delta